MLESKLDPPYYFSSPREGCEVLRSGCVGVSVRLTVSQKRHVQTCHFSAPVACDRGAVVWDNNAIGYVQCVMSVWAAMLTVGVPLGYFTFFGKGVK